MHCGGTQLSKDIRRRQIRTVFGKIAVACRRHIRCICRGGRPSILSPLRLMEVPGSTPELSYLLAKWGSIMPYRRAAEMLGELLLDEIAGERLASISGSEAHLQPQGQPRWIYGGHG